MDDGANAGPQPLLLNVDFDEVIAIELRDGPPLSQEAFMFQICRDQLEPFLP